MVKIIGIDVGGTKCAVTVGQATEKETYLVQETHLPIYHAICAAVEEEFFKN